MPFSDESNREFVLNFVKSNNIQTILDVGAGSGTYSDLLKEHVEYIDGIEVWQPYIKEFDLRSKYRHLGVGDARDLFSVYDIWHDENIKLYDLIIFGDILEHMTEQESLQIWSIAGKIGKWRLLSSPVIHYPQGAEHGNPYEVHVQEHVSADDIRRIYGPFHIEEIYDVTGTFIAGGE